jgi:hypothetical protein
MGSVLNQWAQMAESSFGSNNGEDGRGGKVSVRGQSRVALISRTVG